MTSSIIIFTANIEARNVENAEAEWKVVGQLTDVKTVEALFSNPGIPPGNVPT